MKLSGLIKLKSNNRSNKRLGRGIGTGKGGHTVGKGHKGQKARSGARKPWMGFEGGQVPLYKRLPRMSRFSARKDRRPLAVKLDIFNIFEDEHEVNPVTLWEKKLISAFPKAGVKILSTGDLKKKVKFSGFTFSASALKKIEKAGAKVLK